MNNNLVPLVGLILIVVNLLVCLILSNYEWINAGLSSAVILLNAILVWQINTMGLKDGFRISLDLLMPSFGIIEFFLVACSKPQFEDNGCFVATIVLLSFQLIVLLICRAVSYGVK